MPAEIPEHVDVDVSGLMIGDGVRIRDVADGADWTPVSDRDTLLVHVTAAKTGSADEESEEEAEAAEGEADGGGAVGRQAEP